MLTDMPNLYTEVGAVLYDIGRQPRAAHDFFVKYQDRILFGARNSRRPSETTAWTIRCLGRAGAGGAGRP